MLDNELSSVGFKVGKLIQDRYNNGTLSFNWNGHQKNGQSMREDYVQRRIIENPVIVHSGIYYCKVELKDVVGLKTALENAKKLDYYVVMGELDYDCMWCRSKILLECNGAEIRIKGDPCRFPEGIPVIEVELNVPSGKIIFDNDLREWFPIIGEYDINQMYGMHDTTVAYSKVGMLHGYVGNTCPGVYRQNNRCLTISHDFVEVDKWDIFDHPDIKKILDPLQRQYDALRQKKEYTKTRVLTKELKNLKQEITNQENIALNSPEAKQVREHYAKLIPQGEDVGGICTDLWWYSAVDYDEFKRRYEMKNTKNFETWLKENRIETIVDVDPGVYKLSHYTEARGDCDRPKLTWNGPLHFAKIEWARESDPVVDYIELEKNKQYTAGQSYHYASMLHPMLWGDQYKEHINVNGKMVPDERADNHMINIARWACHNFMSGNESDWHPNGWTINDPSIPGDTPDVEIPEFKGKLFHSQLEDTALSAAAGVLSVKKKYSWTTFSTNLKLNDSFAAVAFNIVQNIIRYGFKDKPCNKLVYEVFEGLCRQYPHCIPDYCQDLHEN